MKNIIYEKPFLTAMRIFTCVASLLLIVVTSLRIYNTFIIKQTGQAVDYYKAILDMSGYTLVLSLILFLLITHNHFAKAEFQGTQKILNLAIYPGLTESDVVLLQKVLQNEQYKNIARAVYKASGTIRNRLNKIYDLLGVMDRMGFISTYLGYEIVFENSSDSREIDITKPK